jgi:hypothetical protein
MWNPSQVEERFYMPAQQQQQQQQQQYEDIYQSERWMTGGWETTTHSDLMGEVCSSMMSPPSAPLSHLSQTTTTSTVSGRSYSGSIFDTNDDGVDNGSNTEISSNFGHVRSISVPADMSFLTQTTETHGSFNFAH